MRSVPQLAPSFFDIYAPSLKPPWQSLQPSYVGNAETALLKITDSIASIEIIKVICQRSEFIRSPIFIIFCSRCPQFRGLIIKVHPDHKPEKSFLLNI